MTMRQEQRFYAVTDILKRMPENNNTNSNILTVTELNEYIRMTLESAPFLKKVTIRGEVSNLKYHSSGVVYFSMKDDGGVINVIMYRTSALKLKFKLQDGMKIIASGRISVYVKSGVYQLSADTLEPDGVGALYIAYEQLKKKLSEEGLFDISRKKQLPKIPFHIGVITSQTGAAVRDIINVIGRRFPCAEIVIYDSLVQGDGAAAQLCSGIKYFNATKRVNVIIIGRGGGSIEDLWPFNDETLARTIAASDIPVISAVGHETDFTICDSAADMRAPTPSAAAEMVVPDSAEIRRRINNVTGHIQSSLNKKIEMKRHSLNQLSDRRVMQTPSAVIDDKYLQLINIESRLTAAQKLNISKGRTDFAALTSKLEALNPMSVITRGYGALFKPDGEVLKSVEQIKTGDKFNVRLNDGVISGTADEVLKGRNDA